MKLHYFEQTEADKDDHFLNAAKHQGYVPQTCLLGGPTVWGLVNKGINPCEDCNFDRVKCKGRRKYE